MASEGSTNVNSSIDTSRSTSTIMSQATTHVLHHFNRFTSTQAACLIGVMLTVSLWIFAELVTYVRRRSQVAEEERDEKEVNVVVSKEAAPPPHMLLDITRSKLLRCLTFDSEAMVACRGALKSAAEVSAILAWFYLVDRTSLFASGIKVYHRETFALIFGALTVVAILSSLKKGKAPVLLNRSQTEEWKGWMQVLFLLYHYFDAKEIYNAIRVFIAGYVWMTGFGNFTYYYKTKDFSIGRFAAMMWRLNFLVVFCCLVLNNSYMLYYICPMHTLFTVMVYAALGIAKGINHTSWGIWAKFAISIVVVFVCWDIKPVFNLIWDRVPWLVHYVNPLKPGSDPMYEWYFRSSLDRYIWVYGMLCAYVHPQVEAGFKKLEELTFGPRVAAKTLLIGATTMVGYLWYTHVYCLPKLEYNAIHPYTSWIPLTCFMVLRNLTPTLRKYALSLYGWLGCITLETYIGQFHTWLKTEVEDGQPKSLLQLVNNRALNFVIVTGIYVLLSRRLFVLTNDLRVALIPTHDDRKLLRNSIMIAVFSVLLYALGVATTNLSALPLEAL